MNRKLLDSKELKQYFFDKKYNCLGPYNVVNNKDTVYITAGIQPILSDFRDKKIDNFKKIYLSQPVIRTQFANSVKEGSSIAFINSTTAGFNISKSEHLNLIKDWFELFYELGINPKKVSSQSKAYERQWGNLLVCGEKTFYYYNDLELGDTTFFTKITEYNSNDNIGIETMSDIGFGLERLRWCLNGKSYFDLYSDSEEILPEIKAYLSVLALLMVNDVKPSNKNSGYRFRLFSKKLVSLLNGKELDHKLKQYLLESINYWMEWQEIDKNINFDLFNDEYIRNCNRYIVDWLIKDGYNYLEKVDINLPRNEFIEKLLTKGVDIAKIKTLTK